MYRLLSYLADPEGASLSPIVWLFLLFAGPILKSVAYQQYIFTSTRLVVRIKSGLTQELYRRALNSMELADYVLDDLAKGQKQPAGKSTASGRLANLMAGDIDAIYLGRDIFLIGIGVPISMVIAFTGLYRILGWPAIVGIAVLVLSAPLPAWLAQLIGSSQRRLKLVQDSRISLVGEYFAQ